MRMKVNNVEVGYDKKVIVNGLTIEIPGWEDHHNYRVKWMWKINIIKSNDKNYSLSKRTSFA